MAIILGGSGVDAAIAVGPNIVTDGLVFHIDPAISDSMVTAQNVPLVSGAQVDFMYGLLGDGQKITFSRDAAYDAQILGSKGYPFYSPANQGQLNNSTYQQGRLSIPIDLGENYTVDMFVKPNYYGVYGNNWLVVDRSYDGVRPTYPWKILFDISYTGIGASNYSTFNISNTGTATTGSSVWWHFSSVFSSTQVTYYRNGKRLQTLASTIAQVKTNKLAYTTGFNDSNAGRGSLGPVKAYNRALTAQEIYQNYNAMKGRYMI